MQFTATVHLTDGPLVAMSGDPADLKLIVGILTSLADGRTAESLDHPDYPGATVGDIEEIELGVFVR